MKAICGCVRCFGFRCAMFSRYYSRCWIVRDLESERRARVVKKVDWLHGV